MGIFRQGGGCKWCEQGDCWSHGGGGGARPVRKTFVKKGSGKGKGAGCKWCAQGDCWSHGGGKGRGKSTGSASGQWLFVPNSSSFGQRKGKGKGKKDASWNRTMDKLGEVEAERKVWIGGLAEDVKWKDLEKHFEEGGATKPKITEILSKGRGVCAFATAEEAQSAISAMNGTELSGETIEVDVWTEKEKKEGAERPKRKFGAAFVKTRSENLTPIDASLKVWVGGLAKATAADTLKKHFVANGCSPDKLKILKPGTACVTFKTEDEASSAIGAVNGTELEGKSVEVDAWTKSEKKVKKEE